MKKLLLPAILGFATLAGLPATAPAGTFGLFTCGCGCGCGCGVTIRPYNAFSPVLCGCITCDSCFPSCCGPQLIGPPPCAGCGFPPGPMGYRLPPGGPMVPMPPMPPMPPAMPGMPGAPTMPTVTDQPAAPPAHGPEPAPVPIPVPGTAAPRPMPTGNTAQLPLGQPPYGAIQPAGYYPGYYPAYYPPYNYGYGPMMPGYYPYPPMQQGGY